MQKRWFVFRSPLVTLDVTITPEVTVTADVTLTVTGEVTPIVTPEVTINKQTIETNQVNRPLMGESELWMSFRTNIAKVCPELRMWV